MQIWDDPKALARIRKWLYLVIVSCLLIVAVHYLLDDRFFSVQRVVIKGKLEKISDDQLQYVVQDRIKGNVFKLDLNYVQQGFEQLSWADQVRVTRQWPDQIVVTITERKALARWVGGGVIDMNGDWFEASTDESLPLFIAPEGSEKQIAQMYIQMLPVLKQMGEPLPKELSLTARNAWQITLKGDAVLKLGRTEPMIRLKRIVPVWKKYLKAQENDIEYIDLRYPDGFALKLRDIVATD